jgi:hypothetical protein
MHMKTELSTGKCQQKDSLTFRNRVAPKRTMSATTRRGQKGQGGPSSIMMLGESGVHWQPRAGALCPPAGGGPLCPCRPQGHRSPWP